MNQGLFMKILLLLAVCSMMLCGCVPAESLPIELPLMEDITPGNADQVEQLRTLQIPDFPEAPSGQCSVAFTPDDAFLAAACKSPVIPMWDLQTGELVRTFEATRMAFSSVAIDPDGTILIAGGFSALVEVWQLATGEHLRSVPTGAGTIREIAFSPDGASFVVVTQHGGIKIFETSTGEELLAIDAHRIRANSAAFNSSGDLLVTGGGDNKARIWALFSPDGTIVAGSSDDSTVLLWNASSGERMARFFDHGGPVNGVTFNAAGSLMASGSNDRSVRLWDVQELKLLATLRGHTDLVLRPAFSHDGRMVASPSWDGTVILWGIPVTELP
jgi:WD40 repeat protein